MEKRTGIDTNPRNREARMLDRCAMVANDGSTTMIPSDGREANVFRVASMVIQSRYPIESKRLMDSAERYYFVRPLDRAPAVDVIHRGDVISLPRLRDMLSRLLEHSRRAKSE
jgi:hypothetical protein